MSPLASADEPAGGVVVVEEARGPDLASAAAVTVLPIDERLPASADLGALLDSAAGANVRRLGGLGDFAAVSVRGSDLRQVQVYLDGVPLNPDGASVVNLSELPLRAFSRVELWRGNAPAALAASPIGGVVNLIPAEHPPPLSGSLTVGSFSTTRLDAMVAGEDLMVYAEAFSTRGDFRAFTDNGTSYNRLDDQLLTRDNNDKAQLTSFARMNFGVGLTKISILDAYLDREEGLPGPIRNPAHEARFATQRNLAVLRATRPLGPLEAQARAFHQLRQERLDDVGDELGVRGGVSEHRFDSAGVVLHAALPRPRVAPSLTLQARTDRSLQSLPNPEDPRRRASYVAALSVPVYLPGWRPELVLQGSALDNRLLGDLPTGLPITPEDQRWILAFTPRAAASWSPTEALVLRAGVGRYQRPPDLTELFGDQGFLIGNPTLLPEEGWQGDLGLRWALPQPARLIGTVELGAFGSRVDNRIVLVQNAQYTSIPINFDRSIALGVEASATLDWRFLESQSAFTFTHTKNLTPRDEVYGKQLPRVPALELSQTTALVWADRARLGHTYTWTARSALDATNWTFAAPRSLHAAFVRVRPTAAPLWLELSALNLTNRIAEVVPLNPLDPSDPGRAVLPLTDFSDYPLPGRTLLLSVRWPN